MADEIQTVDPNTILYSTPSLPNELPPLVSVDVDGDAPIFPIHEDDWSKIEFFNKNQLSEVKALLTEYKEFEEQNRKEVGWQNVYVRYFVPKPLYSAIRPTQKILNILSAQEGNKPIIHSSNAINGLIKNGFSVQVGNDVVLYGYTEGMKLNALGASLGENPDNQSLVNAFVKLNNELELMLIDWHSQFILTGLDESGQILMWQP